MVALSWACRHSQVFDGVAASAVLGSVIWNRYMALPVESCDPSLERCELWELVLARVQCDNSVPWTPYEVAVDAAVRNNKTRLHQACT